MNTSRFLNRAFTLVEMLVVIIIITSILLIAVPSFQSMINSSEAALAESMLKSGMRAGKDAAIRSTGDQDSAVVFFYAPGGRLSMGVFVKAGTLEDRDGANNPVRRDIFVPTGLNESVQLPRGWMVRGFAPPNATSIGNSTDSQADPSTQWYEPSANRPMSSFVGNWVFPETAFYDTSVSYDGGNRQTFMVRFQAGSGIMKMGTADTCLVFVPGPNANWRTAGVFASHRADQTDDAFKFVMRVLNAPGAGAGSLTDQQQRDLLGWECSDMVLARPVSQLALYEEVKLATGIAARVDRTSDCLYRPFIPGTSNAPEYVVRADPANFTRDINRWIIGDTNLDGTHQAFDGSGQVEDAPEARVFTIDRYTGGLQSVEVQ